MSSVLIGIVPFNVLAPVFPDPLNNSCLIFSYVFALSIAIDLLISNCVLAASSS
jgi:hypothetical protein